MKRIIKKPQKTKDILQTLLDQRRLKEGVTCLTEQSISYKIFKVATILAFLVCFFICLFLLLGSELRMAANLSSGGTPETHQIPEIEMVRNSTILVSFMLGFMLISQVLLIIKKPILQALCGILPSVVLLLHYPTIMESKWSLTGSHTYISKNVIPISIFMFCTLVSAVLTWLVNNNNKKGREEINELIYNKYSITADKLTESQWNDIILDIKILTAEAKKKEDSDKFVDIDPNYEEE